MIFQCLFAPSSKNDQHWNNFFLNNSQSLITKYQFELSLYTDKLGLVFMFIG